MHTIAFWASEGPICYTERLRPYIIEEAAHRTSKKEENLGFCTQSWARV